jgi:hypothetical protein
LNSCVLPFRNFEPKLQCAPGAFEQKNPSQFYGTPHSGEEKRQISCLLIYKAPFGNAKINANDSAFIEPALLRRFVSFAATFRQLGTPQLSLAENYREHVNHTTTSPSFFESG